MRASAGTSSSVAARMMGVTACCPEASHRARANRAASAAPCRYRRGAPAGRPHRGAAPAASLATNTASGWRTRLSWAAIRLAPAGAQSLPPPCPRALRPGHERLQAPPRAQRSRRAQSIPAQSRSRLWRNARRDKFRRAWHRPRRWPRRCLLFRQRFFRHHVERRHPDHRLVQRHAQGARKGEPDTLSGERPRAGGHRDPVERGKTQSASRISASTMGASASA